MTGQPTTPAQPQPVEIWHESTWHAGLLLGCRLQPDGSWLACVRFSSPQLSEHRWTRLSHIRPATPDT